jgi:hypothetical protein
MNKQTRQQVYDKYGGRCAYCGKEIMFEDMQADHITAKRNGGKECNPACRRCNHYKRAHSLETFREMLKTLHDRIRQIYICKVAEDYGILEIKECDGTFYFERVGRNEL